LFNNLKENTYYYLIIKNNNLINKFSNITYKNILKDRLKDSPNNYNVINPWFITGLLMLKVVFKV